MKLVAQCFANFCFKVYVFVVLFTIFIYEHNFNDNHQTIIAKVHFFLLAVLSPSLSRHELASHTTFRLNNSINSCFCPPNLNDFLCFQPLGADDRPAHDTQSDNSSSSMNILLTSLLLPAIFLSTTISRYIWH